MPTEYIKTNSEEEWLALRERDITSTDCAALFAMSPYKTELELFYEKQSGERGAFVETARMTAGKFLEPSIAKLAGEQLNCRVLPFKNYARDPDCRMGSSFDYRITRGKYAKWILEIKNVDFLVYRDQWEDDEPPAHIEVQVQHQLELTNRPGAILAVLVGGNDLKLIPMKRNRKMGQGIRKRIYRFWRDVESNNPPEPDYLRDAKFIIAMHNWSGDEVYDATDDDELSSKLIEHRRLKQEAKDLGDRADAIKAEVLDTVGDDCNKIIGKGVQCAIPNVRGRGEEFLLATPDLVGEQVTIEVTEGMVGQEVNIVVTETMVEDTMLDFDKNSAKYGELILAPSRAGFRMFRTSIPKTTVANQS